MQYIKISFFPARGDILWRQSILLLKSLLSRKIWSFDIQEITVICKARLMCQGQHFHCTYGARIMMLNIYRVLKKKRNLKTQILAYKSVHLVLMTKASSFYLYASLLHLKRATPRCDFLMAVTAFEITPVNFQNFTYPTARNQLRRGIHHPPKPILLNNPYRNEVWLP